MKVILLVLDGCRADALEKAGTPSIDSLSRTGLKTHCLSIFPSSTGPAQGSLLTGAYPERTGLVGHFYWDWKKGLVDINSARHCEAEMLFSPLKQSGLSSLSLGPRVSWSGSAGLRTRAIRRVTESVASSQRIMQSSHLFPLLKHLRSNLSFMKMAKGGFESFAKALGKEKDFYYLVLNDTDRAGHFFGPETDKYLAAVETCDRYVGKTLDLLSGEDFTLMITSDHGQSSIHEKIPIEKFYLDKINYRVSDVKKHPVGKEVRIIKYNQGKPNEAVATVVTRHIQFWFRQKEDAPKAAKVLSKIPSVDKILLENDMKKLRLLHPRSGDLILSLKEGYGFDVNPWLGDHGGLNQSDLLVPLIIGSSKPLPKPGNVRQAGIVDIAPTVSKLLGACSPRDCQGRSLL